MSAELLVNHVTMYARSRSSTALAVQPSKTRKTRKTRKRQDCVVSARSMFLHVQTISSQTDAGCYRRTEGYQQAGVIWMKSRGIACATCIRPDDIRRACCSPDASRVQHGQGPERTDAMLVYFVHGV